VPISYVGGYAVGITGSASTTTDVALTSLTGGSDTAPSAGDLVVVFYGTGSASPSGQAITVNSSYTNLTRLTVNATYVTRLIVGYKIMGSTPDTVVNVSQTFAGGNAGSVSVHVFRGVSSTTPLDVTSTTATDGNTVLANPAAITPATAGAWIVAGGAGAHNGGVDTYSSPDLSNFQSVGGPNSTNDSTIGSGIYTSWTSGAFNPGAFTFSDSNSSQFSTASYTLALRPDPNIVVSATGVSGTGQVGSATVTGDATVSPTDVSATGFVGTASVQADAIVSATGVEATGQVGQVEVLIDVDVPVSGVFADSFVGTVVVGLGVDVAATGVEATGQIGQVEVLIDVDVPVSGVFADSFVGTATAQVGVVAFVTGVSATCVVSSVVAGSSAVVTVTGVFATGRVAGVLVWGPISPSQTPGYAAVAPSQNPGYSPVTPGQTPGWTPIAS